MLTADKDNTWENRGRARESAAAVAAFVKGYEEEGEQTEHSHGGGRRGYQQAAECGSAGGEHPGGGIGGQGCRRGEHTQAEQHCGLVGTNAAV